MMRDKVKVALDVPTPAPVRYAVAVLRKSSHVAEARAFVDALAAPAAQKILAQYGFASP